MSDNPTMAGRPAPAKVENQNENENDESLPENQSLNTSVTEDERTEGGPADESGDGKLDTSNDT